ncbi:glycosyltransferase family 2 protein [Acinetobacter sp. YH12066]|uniref:glycosyltransferase family 2 protein n=1 Tax=Acinetobacter sp. YH12066 TaxID=2601063 RepID=UPI0015D260CE|nr:glycosyltransferase family 2 protein [Acinetobacter sp. YH12066]
MNNFPFVTIGIPFYNAEFFLEDAIKSVLAQTYQNWELILVNDGSTDDSLKIAKKYMNLDSRIRLLDDGLNKKLPFRLNQIIDEAKYDYIVRMDADDIMHVNRLQIQLQFLEINKDVDLVSSSMYSIDINNKVVGKRIISDEVTISTLLKSNNQIIHPSIVARKSWFLRNKYDIFSERAEDYELWLRACFNGDLKIKIISEPLLFYREFGNLTKEKLLLSYKTTGFIFNKHKFKMSNFTILKAKIGIYFKIIVVYLLFALRGEGYLIFKRNSSLLPLDLLNAEKELLKAVRSYE